jgi:hypothetical protein
LPKTAQLKNIENYVIHNEHLYVLGEKNNYIGTGSKIINKLSKCINIYKHSNDTTMDAIMAPIEELRIINFDDEFYYKDTKLTQYVQGSCIVLQSVNDEFFIYFPDNNHILKIDNIIIPNFVEIDENIIFSNPQSNALFKNIFTNEEYIIIRNKLLNLKDLKSYPLSNNFFNNTNLIKECNVRCKNNTLYINNLQINLEFIDNDFETKGYIYGEYTIFAGGDNVFILNAYEILLVKYN